MKNVFQRPSQFPIYDYISCWNWRDKSFALQKVERSQMLRAKIYKTLKYCKTQMLRGEEKPPILWKEYDGRIFWERLQRCQLEADYSSENKTVNRVAKCLGNLRAAWFCWTFSEYFSPTDKLSQFLCFPSMNKFWAKNLNELVSETFSQNRVCVKWETSYKSETYMMTDRAQDYSI